MATGTIALKVGDANDNCPSLVNRVEHVCTDTEVVNVTAVDEDGDPNSAPLNFSIVTKESRGEWRVEPLNGEVSLPVCVKKKCCLCSTCCNVSLVQSFFYNPLNSG